MSSYHIACGKPYIIPTKHSLIDTFCFSFCWTIFFVSKFIRLFIQIWSSTFKFDIHMPIPLMYTINHPIHSFLSFPFSFGSGGIHFATCNPYVTSSFIQQRMMVKVWKMEYKLQVVMVPFLLVKELWQTSTWKAYG